MAHQDASPRVRKQASSGWPPRAENLSLAISAILSKTIPIRSSANLRSSLSRLPDGEAVTPLIHLANTSKDSAVREQAVFWLGQSSDPRALDYLTRLLQQ